MAKKLKNKDVNLNINAKDQYENNALHAACGYSGSVEMVNWLLDVCKLGQETKGFAKKTPFLCTVERGQLGIAKALKQRGANIHATDNYGNNALHLTCLFSDNVEMVTWLLNVCKIGIETKGFNQQTPFLCAAQKGQLEIAQELKKRQDDIHATDKNGKNALYYATIIAKGSP